MNARRILEGRSIRWDAARAQAAYAEGHWVRQSLGEVLEHVEQPEVFLRRIAELAKDDAYIFITTCINAPAVDHIYLWRTTDELEEMITASGLTITEPLRLPYEGKTLEESREENLPINVAYVLAKTPTA